MKKVMMLAMMVVGVASYAVAQDAKLPEKSDKGQAVRTAAQGSEKGKEKGQLVAKTANHRGVEKSTEAKAKGRQEKAVTTSEVKANHGADVKQVATDKTITGKEKGEAVKTVARSNPKAKGGERAVRERPARPERASRPERAKRPTTSRKPSVPGRQ